MNPAAPGHARRRWVLLAAAVLVALATHAPGSAAPAAADQQQEGPGVQIRVEGVAPAVPQPAGDLRISGTVRNTGDTTVTTMQVALRVSPTPMRGRYEIDSIAAGTDERTGNTLFDTLTTISPELAPGAEAAFTLSVPTADLGLGVNGVYVAYVDGIGIVDGAETVLAKAPVLLPWTPDPDAITPTGLVMLWPITAAVPQAAGDVMSSDSLAVAMAPGGDLDRRVAAATGSPVPLSWLVDPAVAEAARTMSTGYSVAGSTADVTDGSAAAAAWSAALTAASSARGQRTSLLPFGQVDAAALARAGMPGGIESAARISTVAKAAGGSRFDLVIAASPSGTSTAAAAGALVGAGVPVAVVSDRFVPPVPGLTYTPTGLSSVSTPVGELPLVVTDAVLAASLPQTGADAAALVTSRQRLLAETAMISLEAPAIPRTVALLPSRLFNYPVDWTRRLLAEFSRAPWLQVQPLGTLLAQASTADVRQPWRDAGRKVELPQPYVQQLPALQRRADKVAAIRVEPGSVAGDFRAALLRAASSQWRPDMTAAQDLVDTIDGQLDAAEAGVRIVSAGQITLSGDTGQLPLTIANDLDADVEVRIALQATPSIRLAYTEPDPQVVPAGRRVSIEVPVTLYGTGRLPVEVSIRTPDGQPFGSPQQITLTSTAAATIAAAVAIVGAAALVLLIVTRIIRGTRKAHRD